MSVSYDLTAGGRLFHIFAGIVIARPAILQGALAASSAPSWCAGAASGTSFSLLAGKDTDRCWMMACVGLHLKLFRNRWYRMFIYKRPPAMYVCCAPCQLPPAAPAAFVGQPPPPPPLPPSLAAEGNAPSMRDALLSSITGTGRKTLKPVQPQASDAGGGGKGGGGNDLLNEIMYVMNGISEVYVSRPAVSS